MDAELELDHLVLIRGVLERRICGAAGACRRDQQRTRERLARLVAGIAALLKRVVLVGADERRAGREHLRPRAIAVIVEVAPLAGLAVRTAVEVGAAIAQTRARA